MPPACLLVCLPEWNRLLLLMDGPAFTNNVSMIFNKVFQEQQLKSLQKSLLSDQNNVLATILSERLKSSFGLKALPSLDDVLPFIHFDESGQTHFTLIYTSSLLSPFALICSHYFGRHVMNLQREVYHMLYTNTLNISDSDAEGEEEMPDEQPPPVLSYANGVTRDSVYQKSCTNAAHTSAEAEESRGEGGRGEDSSESLLSYSMSALISPALRCGSLADAAKQQAHDSSACSPPDTVEQQSQEKTANCAAKAQLSKKYKCDRCAKVSSLVVLVSSVCCITLFAPQSFSVRSHLDSHKVTHTGEKRYKCPRCGNR